MIEGRDIVCISTSDWDRPWGSRQQIMLRLSKKNRILYIEYQASVLHPLYYPRLRGKRLLSSGRLRQGGKNLFIYTPIPSLPFALYFRLINRINQGILAFCIKRLLARLGFKDYILWIYPPWSADLIGSLKAEKVVYHCIDAFASEKKSLRRRRTISYFEERIFERADHIFMLSKKRYADCLKMHKSIHYLPSAVDEAFLNARDNLPLDDLERIRPPRLGITGIFDERLDAALIKEAALEHPRWSFILIGPIVSNRREIISLRSLPNVHFLGVKDYAQLPYYQRKFDICLIPYKVNEFTSNISPLKLYEYFSAGRPVVATALPEACHYGGLLRVAKDKAEFIGQIKELLDSGGDALAGARIKVAEENTWGSRLQIIEGVLQ